MVIAFCAFLLFVTTVTIVILLTPDALRVHAPRTAPIIIDAEFEECRDEDLVIIPPIPSAALVRVKPYCPLRLRAAAVGSRLDIYV